MLNTLNGVHSKPKFAMTIVAVIWLAVVGLSIYGYVNNIVEFAQSAETLSQSNLLIARIAGFFIAPLGVVLGFI